MFTLERALSLTLAYFEPIKAWTAEPRVGLMQTRRDPELMLREVSPLTCSPERAWREMSPPTHGCLDLQLQCGLVEFVDAIR